MRIVTLFLATSLTFASLGCENTMMDTTPDTTPPASGTTTTPPPPTTPSTTPTTPGDSTVPSPTDTQPGTTGDKGAVDDSGAVREVEPKPSEK